MRGYARTRAQYGFRRDIAYIQQLIASRQWASWLDGPGPPLAAFPATPTEERYVELRHRLELGAAGQRYLTRHADVSGGYSIEDGWPGRPFLLVRFTRDVREHLAALRRVARFPRHLRAKRARFSERDLQRIVARIHKDERVLRRAGFREPFVELVSSVAGRVEISVTTRRDDYRAYFAARYGPAVKVLPRIRATTVYECARTRGFSLSADGRRLTLRWTTNDFVKEDRVELVEFADRVVVGAVQRRPSTPELARDPVDNAISVELAAPLGQRHVIDAGSLRRVRQEGPGPGEPACPQVHEPSRFDQFTRENEKWGLPADPASVQRRVDAYGTIPPDQERWLGQLTAVKPSSNPAISHYLLVHSDEYAGEVLVGEFPAPRRLIYRFSGHAAEHEAALKRLVQRPELLSTETVRQLQAWCPLRIGAGLVGRDLADPDLVAVGVVEDVLAGLAVVLELGRLDAAPGDRLRRRVEVGDHDGHERAAGLRRVLEEVEPAMLADRPHGLDVVGEERGLASEEPFVPGARDRDVTDPHAGEEIGEVHRHVTTLRP